MRIKWTKQSVLSALLFGALSQASLADPSGTPPLLESALPSVSPLPSASPQGSIDLTEKIRSELQKLFQPESQEKCINVVIEKAKKGDLLPNEEETLRVLESLKTVINQYKIKFLVQDKLSILVYPADSDHRLPHFENESLSLFTDTTVFEFQELLAPQDPKNTQNAGDPSCQSGEGLNPSPLPSLSPDPESFQLDMSSYRDSYFKWGSSEVQSSPTPLSQKDLDTQIREASRSGVGKLRPDLRSILVPESKKYQLQWNYLPKGTAGKSCIEVYRESPKSKKPASRVWMGKDDVQLDLNFNFNWK